MNEQADQTPVNNPSPDRTPLIEKRHFPKLMVVLLLLLLVVTGSVLLYARNKNALYARTYAQEVVTSYEGLKDSMLVSVMEITRTKTELASSIGRTLTSMNDQASFSLYAKDAGTSEENQDTVDNLEKQGNVIAESIRLMQQRPAPEKGEILKESYIGLLQANLKLGMTILAFNKSQIALQNVYKKNLTEAFASLDRYILDPDSVTQKDFASMSAALRVVTTESATAISEVEKHTAEDRVLFMKNYYKQVLNLNISFGNNVLAAIDKNDISGTKTLIKEYHEKLYTQFTGYRQDLSSFINKEVLEVNGIPEVMTKEKEFNTALNAFIKSNNLTIEVPEESLTDALKRYLVNQTQKIPSDVITERQDTYLVGFGAWDGVFVAMFNEGTFDFELISPDGTRITRANVDEYPEIYSSFEKTFIIYKIKPPLLKPGTWTMIAKGPENLDVTLSGSSQGDEIFVEVQRYPEDPKLNEKVLLVGTVHEPELVKDAKIYVRVGSYSGYDDKGVVLLQPVTNFPELEKEVIKVVKPGTDMEAVYVAVFDNTKQYGTYCFDGKAQWTYKTGEPIERDMLTGWGCTIISPEKK